MRVKGYAIKAALILAAFVMFTAPALAGETYPARVVCVCDGDTIEVVRGNDTLDVIKVRLYGIDAPESGQAHGKKAAKHMARLVSKQLVRVEVMDTDRYGRTVGIVQTEDGEDARLQLVEAGYAWIYPKYCKRAAVCDGYRAAEDRARADKRGLWQDKEPAPPWEWRK